MLRTYLRSYRKPLSRRFATSSAEPTFVTERNAVKEHAYETSDLWRKISIYVCVPALLIAGVNAYNLYTAHQAHVLHEAEENGDNEDNDTPEYPYQNIRTKNFWGDGDKTLFWNDKVNKHKE
ncbi:protein of unknown function [Taphrina deformans PYCC 5710]|uniref:Cytochrome c oxidase subunit 13, mitochondrial n=1 Tax=Taphrina deformans (strain PYCC 5710 / ATCC 11124 / CBS 356.35 / IMI 108563 / JCM 9778 / NBRC 8474) TaxID=1097556 RepID=R4XMD6_TAPDE|nr:protein of unknown function [Taphrina deformans PYCC 5710]|eukprot:CCG84465.1 protein of unknown function [Taphrina deformans PYCC 5710]